MHSDGMPDYMFVAAWGIQRGLIELPHEDIVRRLSRIMSRISRQDYFVGDNGEPVRRRFAYQEKRGERQLTLWVKMENTTPEKMMISGQSRRNGALMDVLQIDRDFCYFNKHHNPGDPIQLDFDFNKDVAERHMPTEYPDAPPEVDGIDETDDQSEK